MNIIEALSDPRFVSEELWTRPTSWKGNGRAYAVNLSNPVSRLQLVPGSPAADWSPSRGAILEDWELVTPEQVLGERA
jgi:hypothetical protein